MKTDKMRESSNVEDRRGQSSSGGLGSSGMGFGGGSGILGLLLQLLFSGRGGGKWIMVLILGALLMGGGSGLGSILTGGTSSNVTQQPQTNQTSTAATASEDEKVEFLSKVLASTEDFWHEEFAKEGRTYNEPGLVVYTGGTQTGGCGYGQATYGPFYCPADQKVYIDLSFYNDLTTKYNAAGDFAMAYVVAHEVGHHVQNELGIMTSFNKAKQSMSEVEGNALTVRLELQADYLAGAWAKYADGQGLLDNGDISEALAAANAVGDDTLQKEAYGRVVPDSFTHGTSKQRTGWFSRGYQYGDLAHSDAFNADIDNP